MLAALGYAVELAGFSLLIAAGYLVALPLALAIAGVGLILAAQAGRR